MSETLKLPTCGKCGAALSGYAPDGLCAACLLESAFEERDVQFGDPAKPAPLFAFRDYELLEEIARGGMGVVYRARQISLNRPVAIKMILGGHLANAAEMQRFRVEAETAAQLQHPNIVAIHEVGEHAGQPFFSMDFVAGRSLAQWVHDGPLPARKAATYLKTIAEAVQYAHSCSVLHRDLKPSNILIDDADRPRVTDFGLAKRLDDPQLSPTDSQLTQTGQVLGSPSFIPPEQAAGQKDKIGPASDVYSLGAMLYHCLTARPPFMAETLTQTLRMVAENDAVSPRLLNASVPRDLETICLKCLEKDPQRRYATAQELADELGRFLRDEPIHARPVGVVLKVHRWCLRNQPLAMAGTAILALLLVVAIGSPIAAYRINGEREGAQKEAAKSLAALNIMASMLEGVDPAVARGRDNVVLRQILDNTAKRVVTDLKDQPLVEADLRIIFGKTYSAIGMITNALEMTQEALRLRQLHLGPTNEGVAFALNNLGTIRYDANDYAGAERYAREALTIRTNLYGLWHTNVATSLNNLGLALWNLGRYRESLEAAQQALAIRRKLQPDDHFNLGMSAVNLAGLQFAMADFNSAETSLVEALDLFRRARHPVASAVVQANLAVISWRRGDLAAARDLNDRVLADRRQLFTSDHPHLEISLTQLGLVQAMQGDLSAAETNFNEARAMQGRLGLSRHEHVADALAGLGLVAVKRGQWVAATTNYQPALAIRLEVLKEEGNADVVDTLDALGLLAIAQGDLGVADQTFARAVKGAKASESPEYPAVIPALWHHSWVLQKRGNLLAADNRRREALALSLKHGVYGAWPLLKGIYDLTDVFQAQGKFAEAKSLLEDAADYGQKHLGGNLTLQRDTYQRLVNFFEAWDRAAPNAEAASQAAEWSKKLEALR